MAQTFGQAATKGLTAAMASQRQSTENSREQHHQHFLKCLRLWNAMLPKKAGDDIDGELLAKGYYRMLGHLSIEQINDLTEMVLDNCKWFPTVAECRDLMARDSYSNPFRVEARRKELIALGYGTEEEVKALAGPSVQLIADNSDEAA